MKLTTLSTAPDDVITWSNVSQQPTFVIVLKCICVAHCLYVSSGFVFPSEFIFCDIFSVMMKWFIFGLF